MSARGRRRTLAALVLGFLLAGTGAALAYWTVTTLYDSNLAVSQAASISKGSTPGTPTTNASNGNNVTVTFSSVTLTNTAATPVTSYTVTRYPAAGGSAAASFSCTGTGTVTCLESGVPDGSWKYTDTGKYGTNWVGPVSDLSASVAVDTTPPTVSGVSSTLADGSYKAGQVVPVTVTFSEPVTVTGTPQLTLSTGSPVTTAVNYTSGSGTSTLTFNYTVAAGNTSADLDYAAPTSLALNGGTIRDAATNNATLTLASPGAAGSLGANKNLVIDTTAPTVTSVSSTLANGTYPAGQVVPVTVTFSEPVTVTGTPQLTLSTGSPVTTAVNYSSGSGTSTLTFNYAVAAGNTSADLDYAATTSLGLNSGTIQDAAMNNATLTLASPGAAGSLGASKNIVIDGVAPAVTNVTSTLADGSYKAGQVVPVRVTFNKAVTVTGTPQLTLSTGSPATTAVNYSSGSGTSTLTFNYTVAAGNSSPDLDYSATTSLGPNGGTIRDAATNDATLTLASPGAAGSLGANKAIVIDTTAPTVSTINLAGTSPSKATTLPFTVTFSEPVNTSAVVAARFAVTTSNVTGTAPSVGTVTPVSPSGGFATSYTVNVSTASAVGANNGWVRLDLTSVGTIQDAATNGLAATHTGDQSYTFDTTLPTVSSVSSSLANGSYKAGQVVPVTVTFSEPVTVTGTPTLTLNTTSPATTAVNYASGSGTGTLTFNYTVTAGNTSADLDYAATSSLALAGGSIKDAATNNATLTLANPGAAGSLGANKNIVIDTTAPTVSSVTSTLANGSYKAGQVVPVTVTFTEAVTVTGTPQLTLSTGSPATTAVNYSSGSGTSTLTFDYTVAAGNTSADLDYASTSALALNGGTIQDTATNNATLTLAAPAAAGSLGANKNIVIDTTAPAVTVTSLSSGGGASKVSSAGTGENGAGSVTVYLCHTSPCAVGNAVFTGTATVSGGTWSDTSGNIGSGTYYATATQTDAAGNTGTSSTFGPFVR